MGTHSGPTPPVCVCEGGHVGTSSSTATPRGVTWRRGGTWLPPGYSCPPRGLQTAAHTSATNSWGKANSPSTESRAQASAAAVGLHFAISTMVAAAGGVGSGGGGGGCRAGGARSSTHPARSRGCPCSSPAGRPRGARLLPPRRWAVGGMGCQAWRCPVRHGPPRPVQGVVGVAGVPHLLLQRGWALCTQSQRFLPTGRSALGRALAAAPRPLPDHI